MTYRTRTYIAADWEHDKNAVDKLYEWNNSNHWGLSFGDAHELSKCRSDDTNNCNIKKNCSQNLDYSKCLVLIIGQHTKSLRAGYCMYCKRYSTCSDTYKTNKSYVEFECDYAIRHDLPIIAGFDFDILPTAEVGLVYFYRFRENISERTLIVAHALI